jgi:Leucine-rich repeat (LRR) protein
MQYFGIISLLIVVALAAWQFGKNSNQVSDVQTDLTNVTEEATSDSNAINDVLDSAKNAANQLGEAVPTGPRVTIYDGISVPKDITAVNLSGRGLTGSLKAEINQLTAVKSLDLSDNKFTGLPAEVGQLSTLEVLDLSSNPFTGLPHEIGNLQKLKLLNLKGTNYAKQDLEVIKAKLPATTQILTD